jgi:hypothetical protein
VSQAYASLKDADSAFAWLEKAFETRDLVLVRLKIDPAWDSSETTPAIPISSAASDSRPDYRI